MPAESDTGSTGPDRSALAPWPDPADPTTAVLDQRTLRAMAHPVRIRLLGILRDDGPSTATRLAARLALNSGATSYHLRQLAAAGFVVEDDQRGSARERWWRAVHRSTLLVTDRLDPADDVATLAYLRSVADRYAERMRRAVEDLGSAPPEWRNAWDISDYRLRLTPQELQELLHGIRRLVAASRQGGSGDRDLAAVPPDARSVVLQVQAFLAPAGDARPSEGDQ